MEPVFVDRTGRRLRLFKVAGLAGGAALLLATAGLLAGFTGAGAGVLPGLPGIGPTPAEARLPELQPSSHPAPRKSTPAGSAQPRTQPPAPTATASPSASPSPTTRRNVPTQTPSHGKKR
jgi:hypothetical protein